MENGTDYSSYLRTHDYLELQAPLTDDPPDELLWIVVHQSYELWFKVIIDELRRLSVALHAVAELLMDHDGRVAAWRYQHTLMAGRQIGRSAGTGGSEGKAYLDTTIAQRFYPVLWHVRSVL